MGVFHQRKRVANRTPQGGGITGESLTDTATDGDIMEHDTGEGPSGFLGDVELDYQENYGPFATDADSTDAYTGEEARADASRFATRPYDRSELVRDVAQEWRSGTVTLDANAEAYLIAGADPLRKRLVVINATQAAFRTGDVFLGNDAGVPYAGGPALLLPGAIAGVTNFVSIEMTHTGEVWLIPARYVSVVGVPVTVTYLIERYYR